MTSLTCCLSSAPATSGRLALPVALAMWAKLANVVLRTCALLKTNYGSSNRSALAIRHRNHFSFFSVARSPSCPATFSEVTSQVSHHRPTIPRNFPHFSNCVHFFSLGVLCEKLRSSISLFPFLDRTQRGFVLLTAPRSSARVSQSLPVLFRECATSGCDHSKKTIKNCSRNKE
jgi:hypothetical protein